MACYVDIYTWEMEVHRNAQGEKRTLHLSSVSTYQSEEEVVHGSSMVVERNSTVLLGNGLYIANDISYPTL